jgi:enterochelin esterase family protein
MGRFGVPPEAEATTGIPAGTVTSGSYGPSSIYPGNIYSYSVYHPAPRTSGAPASLLVVLDGDDTNEKVRVTTVLDNIIAHAEIPPVVGVFVNPGNLGPGLPIYGGHGNRSVEYDSLGDTYAQFLLTELLPHATRGLNITDDPAMRAVFGVSSGAAAAFTVAWEQPNRFGCVLSAIGSFTDIRGADRYPTLIRRHDPKPIKVFLQSGENDLDTIFGSWPIANKSMAAALAYRDYEYRFEYGDGGHSLDHMAELFPDALRWLWANDPSL